MSTDEANEIIQEAKSLRWQESDSWRTELGLIAELLGVDVGEDKGGYRRAPQIQPGQTLAAFVDRKQS